jgi:hypothetical protein
MDNFSNENKEPTAAIEQNKPEKDKEKDLTSWKHFLLGMAVLVVLVGIFGIVLSVRAVRNLSELPIVLKVAEVLNLPVARVNGNFELCNGF